MDRRFNYNSGRNAKYVWKMVRKQRPEKHKAMRTLHIAIPKIKRKIERKIITF